MEAVKQDCYALKYVQADMFTEELASAEQEAIELLKKNGYKIIKD